MLSYPWRYGTGCTEVTDVPSTGMNVLQNQQKFGYGYESPTELPKVWVLWHVRTDLTDVPGTGMNALQN